VRRVITRREPLHRLRPTYISDVKPYRPRSEGIREWQPRSTKGGPIVITERSSPSIRSVRGWLFPLEHYDENLKLNVLEQYVELLLVMASAKPIDFDSIVDIMREARDRLDDEEYGRLLAYKALLESARMGISAELR
jgi:hypothetical protein